MDGFAVSRLLPRPRGVITAASSLLGTLSYIAYISGDGIGAALRPAAATGVLAGSFSIDDRLLGSASA